MVAHGQVRIRARESHSVATDTAPRPASVYRSANRYFSAAGHTSDESTAALTRPQRCAPWRSGHSSRYAGQLRLNYERRSRHCPHYYALRVVCVRVCPLICRPAFQRNACAHGALTAAQYPHYRPLSTRPIPVLSPARDATDIRFIRRPLYSGRAAS